LEVLLTNRSPVLSLDSGTLWHTPDSKGQKVLSLLALLVQKYNYRCRWTLVLFWHTPAFQTLR
jgi:hypothetical protein